jgi:hypothetical protein
MWRVWLACRAVLSVLESLPLPPVTPDVVQSLPFSWVATAALGLPTPPARLPLPSLGTGVASAPLSGSSAPPTAPPVLPARGVPGVGRDGKRTTSSTLVVASAPAVRGMAEDEEGSGDDGGLSTTGVNYYVDSSEEEGGEGGEGGLGVAGAVQEGVEEEEEAEMAEEAAGGAGLRRSSRKTKRRVSMVGGFAVLKERSKGVSAMPQAPRKARSAFW